MPVTSRNLIVHKFSGAGKKAPNNLRYDPVKKHIININCDCKPQQGPITVDANISIGNTPTLTNYTLISTSNLTVVINNVRLGGCFTRPVLTLAFKNDYVLSNNLLISPYPTPQEPEYLGDVGGNYPLIYSTYSTYFVDSDKYSSTVTVNLEFSQPVSGECFLIARQPSIC